MVKHNISILLLIVILLLTVNQNAFSKQKKEEPKFVSITGGAELVYWDAYDDGGGKNKPIFFKDLNITFYDLFGFEGILNYSVERILGSYGFEQNDMLTEKKPESKRFESSIFRPFFNFIYLNAGVYIYQFEGYKTAENDMTYYNYSNSDTLINEGEKLFTTNYMQKYGASFGYYNNSNFGIHFQFFGIKKLYCQRPLVVRLDNNNETILVFGSDIRMTVYELIAPQFFYKGDSFGFNWILNYGIGSTDAQNNYFSMSLPTIMFYTDANFYINMSNVTLKFGAKWDLLIAIGSPDDSVVIKKPLKYYDNASSTVYSLEKDDKLGMSDFGIGNMVSSFYITASIWY